MRRSTVLRCWCPSRSKAGACRLGCPGAAGGRAVPPEWGSQTGCRGCAGGRGMVREEYALSARTMSGLVRGRPQRRGTRRRAMTSGKTGASAGPSAAGPDPTRHDQARHDRASRAGRPRPRSGELDDAEAPAPRSAFTRYRVAVIRHRAAAAAATAAERWSPQCAARARRAIPTSTDPTAGTRTDSGATMESRSPETIVRPRGEEIGAERSHPRMTSVLATRSLVRSLTHSAALHGTARHGTAGMT